MVPLQSNLGESHCQSLDLYTISKFSIGFSLIALSAQLHHVSNGDK